VRVALDYFRDGSMATPPAWSGRSIPIWPSDPRTTLLPPGNWRS
jgi:hypothetical protein